MFLRNKAIAIVLVVALSGCAQFASKEAVVGCQAADAVTTVVALSAGASEANPLMAGIISSFGFGGLIVVKALVAWVLLSVAEEAPESVGAVTAVTCGIAVHNLLL